MYATDAQYARALRAFEEFLAARDEAATTDHRERVWAEDSFTAAVPPDSSWLFVLARGWRGPTYIAYRDAGEVWTWDTQIT